MNSFLRSTAFFTTAAMICFTVSGCSLFRSPTQTITVSSDQPDAQIYINGSMAGQGTASMPVKRDENVQVMAKKAGYITSHRNIGKSFSNTGILDLIGGCIILLPFFGLLAPGAYSLDQTNISIPMAKE